MGLPHLGQRGTSSDGTRISRCYDTMTARTASSAARSFGKWNSPVEMQQNATLLRPCRSARARQERQQEHSSASSRSVGLPGTMGPTVCRTYLQGRLYADVSFAPPGSSSRPCSAMTEAHSSRSWTPARFLIYFWQNPGKAIQFPPASRSGRAIPRIFHRGRIEYRPDHRLQLRLCRYPLQG